MAKVKTEQQIEEEDGPAVRFLYNMTGTSQINIHAPSARVLNYLGGPTQLASKKRGVRVVPGAVVGVDAAMFERLSEDAVFVANIETETVGAAESVDEIPGKYVFSPGA